MLGLLLFFILISLGLYALNEYQKVQFGIIHKKMPAAAIEALANLIEDTNAQRGRILELGSGYGTFVLGIAKRLPDWDVVGVEQLWTPWIISNLRSFGKRYTNYRFQVDDPMIWPLRGYDIVFIHHDEAVLRKWEQSLARRLQPETLLITMNSRLPRVNAINTLKVDPNLTFYVYQKRLQPPALAPEPTPEEIAEETAAEAVATEQEPSSTTVSPDVAVPEQQARTTAAAS